MHHIPDSLLLKHGIANDLKACRTNILDSKLPPKLHFVHYTRGSFPFSYTFTCRPSLKTIGIRSVHASRRDHDRGILVPIIHSSALVHSPSIQRQGLVSRTYQLSIGFSLLFVAVSRTSAHLDRNSEWLITFVNLPVMAL